MLKKISKIGLILVLTLSLILSSLGALTLVDKPTKEFNVVDKNEITAQAATAWDGSTKTEFAKGTGTFEDPFQISTGAELAYLAQQVNANQAYSMNKHFILTADIVLNAETITESSTGANPWTPIGQAFKPFVGRFDGQGHTVSGIYINSTATEQGLFGLVGSVVDTSATVKNLNVTNSYIKGTYAGAIAGQTSGKIINCANSGKVTGTDKVGGVVGCNFAGTVTDCRNDGVVSGTANFVGGVIGQFVGSSTGYPNIGVVTNCVNNGKVNGLGSVGGVVGGNGFKDSRGNYPGGDMTNCQNTGAVTGTNNVGGVLGSNGDKDTNGMMVNNNGGKVIKCDNSGVVSGKQSVGGLVGFCTGGLITNCHNKTSGALNSNLTDTVGGIGGVVGFIGGTTVINCDNRAAVTANNTSNVGGVVGVTSGFNTINNCFNEGVVNGKDYVGGVVGFNTIGATVINCYNIPDKTGTAGFVGGIAGQNYGKVINCYSFGETTGTSNIGGIAGHTIGNDSTNQGIVENCYTISVVNSIANSKVGGAVGEIGNFGTLKNSYYFKDQYHNTTLNAAGVGSSSSCGSLGQVGFIIKPDAGSTIIGGEPELVAALNAGAEAYNIANPAPLIQAKSWGIYADGWAEFKPSSPLPTITPISSKEYNAEKQSPLPITFEGATQPTVLPYVWEFAADGNTFSAVTGEPEFILAGTYRVTATGIGDYDGSKATTDYLITKKEVTLKWTAPTDLVYDKTAKTPTVEIASGAVAGDTCSVNTPTVTNGTNNIIVGDFTFTAELSNPNYSIANSVSPIYTITKRPLTNIYVQKEVAAGNVDFGPITLFGDTAKKNCDGLINGDVVTISFKTSSDAKGAYTGDAGIIGDITQTGAFANYSFTKADITAKITGKLIPDFELMNSKEYNGGKQEPTATIPGLTLTTDYTLSWEFKPVGGKTLALRATPDFINAGTYRVTATGVDVYDGSTQVGEYIITPKVVALNWTAPAKLVYTGQPIVPTVEVKSTDLIATDKCEVTASLTEGTDNINAGTPFTFTATKLSNPNYALPTPAVSAAYTIAQAPNAWKNTPPLSMPTAYAGATLNPKAESLYGEAVFSYYEDIAGTKGSSLAHIPDAIGTYWVTASVGEDTNYTELVETQALQFKITKRPASGDDGPVTSITQNDVFWTAVISDIKNKDGMILKRECDYGTMPKKVLESLQEKGKTLDITMMGENLYITSEKIKGLTFSKDEYTIAEIKAMLADKPVITPTPTPDPVEPVPEKPANLLWLWILLGVIAVGAVVTIVIIVGKKKKEDEEDKNNDNNVDNNIK